MDKLHKACVMIHDPHRYSGVFGFRMPEEPARKAFRPCLRRGMALSPMSHRWRVIKLYMMHDNMDPLREKLQKPSKNTVASHLCAAL